MKRCFVCGEEKDESLFYPCRSGKDGLRRRCKACVSAERKAYYAKHRAEILASWRDRYAADPARRRDAVARSAEYRGRNPEKTAVYMATYRATHTEEALVASLNFRAKQAGAAKSITVEDRRRLLGYYGHRCAYCLRPESEVGTLALDHMVPLSRGGENAPDNLVPACQSCNSRKRNRTPLEFLASMAAPARADFICDAAA